MTTFFRAIGNGFEYLVSDLQWKHLRGVESNSKYTTQVDPLFKRYTHMGVRETHGKTMTLGVIAKENDMPVEPQKGISLALTFRHHSITEAVRNPQTETDKFENLVVYIAKLQDDSWSVTGITHGRIAIDTAFKIKEVDSDSKTGESKPSVMQNNAMKICDRIADQYLKDTDAYSIRLVTVGLDQQEHDELIPHIKTGLHHLGDSCKFESTSHIPSTIQQFIAELGIQKTWYIANIKRFNQKESKTLTTYLTGVAIAVVAMYGSYVAFIEKPTPTSSNSSAWDTPKSVKPSTPPKPTIVSQAISSADMDRETVALLKQQERDWYADYIRKFGFNTALTMKTTAGSAPSKVEGYKLANVTYERLHQVGRPSLGEIVMLRYVREDRSALVTTFIDALLQYNESIRIRDKDISLDGEIVVAVMTIPNPALENPYKESSERMDLPSFIATLQSYEGNDLINAWGISSTPETKRPNPISTNELRSVQRHYQSEEYKEGTLLTEITAYKVTINSNYLRSLNAINQILQANPSALIESFTFDVTTSALTTEIKVYDIN